MPPGVQIRRLTEGDAEAMRDLRQTALESEPTGLAESPEEYRHQTVAMIATRLGAGSGDHFVMGAFDGSQLVGTAGLYREMLLKRRHIATMWGVFVLPSHRGRGIARSLIAAIVERARAAPGLLQIHLSVASDRQDARGLYVSLGFRSYGVEPAALQVDGAYFDVELLCLPLADTDHPRFARSPRLEP